LISATAPKLAPLGVVNGAEAQRPAWRCEEAKVLDGKIVEVDALRAHVGFHLLHRPMEQAGMCVVDEPVAVQGRTGRVGHGVEPLNTTTLLSKTLGLAEKLYQRHATGETEYLEAHPRTGILHRVE
jgi:hypothetical protein